MGKLPQKGQRLKGGKTIVHGTGSVSGGGFDDGGTSLETGSIHRD